MGQSPTKCRKVLCKKREKFLQNVGTDPCRMREWNRSLLLQNAGTDPGYRHTDIKENERGNGKNIDVAVSACL
jgi:hypothetical protein